MWIFGKKVIFGVLTEQKFYMEMIMKEKSIILLSGGLDSVVNFKAGFDDTEVDFILTFDYGQAAAKKEIEAMKLIATEFGVSYKVIKLSFLDEISNSLKNGKIIDFDGRKFDNLEYTIETAKSVWVPNRNALFINIAAAFAEVSGAKYIFVGFNKEEGITFPDNSSEFIEKINESLKYSTLIHPRVKSVTIDMIKSEIVFLGKKINAPFKYVWSCYRGGEKMCGRCESCQRLKRALNEADFYNEFLNLNIWGFEE